MAKVGLLLCLQRWTWNVALRLPKLVPALTLLSPPSVPPTLQHHPDLIMCRKQPGIGALQGFSQHMTRNVTVVPSKPVLACTCTFAAIGRLCEKCDGKCPICDSYVRPATLVRVCDECNYGSYEGRCVICGGTGVSDAYYCKECTLQEKDVSGMEPATHDGPETLYSTLTCSVHACKCSLLHA